MPTCVARSEIEETRFSVLEDLFQNVPPAPRVKDPTIFDKIPKLWSPDDLDMLIQFLVKITLDMQQEGTSELVATVSTRLRTLLSHSLAFYCMG